MRIIRENCGYLNLPSNFSIIDSDDVLTVIKKILKDMNLDIKQYSPSYIRNRISFIKNQMLSEMELDKFFNTPIDKIVVDVYYKYNERLIASAAAGRAYVAGDLTMTGKQLYPLGDLKFEELVEVYREQAKIICEAGADLL